MDILSKFNLKDLYIMVNCLPETGSPFTSVLIYTAQLLNCFQSFYPGQTEISLESHNEQRIFLMEC